jgi:hypothetical protein
MNTITIYERGTGVSLLINEMTTDRLKLSDGQSLSPADFDTAHQASLEDLLAYCELNIAIDKLNAERASALP